jgi:CarD family transcriptional regulator
MFKVGEIVVYPRQGAGKVVARERKHILGEDHEYLTIRIFQSELTMLVRCDGAEAAGIRPVVAKQALQEIIDVLTGDVAEQDANWNRRFRAHQEQLKSSDPRELAGVIRNLARRQDEKGLSGGERQLLLRAKRLLASELQYARKTDEEEALAWIDDVLSPQARAA